MPGGEEGSGAGEAEEHVLLPSGCKKGQADAARRPPGPGCARGDAGIRRGAVPGAYRRAARPTCRGYGPGTTPRGAAPPSICSSPRSWGWSLPVPGVSFGKAKPPLAPGAEAARRKKLTVRSPGAALPPVPPGFPALPRCGRQRFDGHRASRRPLQPGAVAAQGPLSFVPLPTLRSGQAQQARRSPQNPLKSTRREVGVGNPGPQALPGPRAHSPRTTHTSLLPTSPSKQ